uniref:Purple acid phosphatase n=1 Tax=Cannabis sativa TaxID=3483 RepID=A0A803P839_CANSA
MVTLLSLSSSVWGHIVIPYEDQPLSKINILKTQLDLQGTATISAQPLHLYQKGRVEAELEAEWVTVTVKNSKPSNDDWVGVFSPGKFDSSSCPPKGPEDKELESPYICSAPIKFQYANHSSKNYVKSGEAKLKFLLINMRSDFSFALFSGGFSAPKLVSISDVLSVFANPKAPLYPRLAIGKSWDIMTVTWTSGYNIDEAVPFVEWGLKGETQQRSPAGYLSEWDQFIAQVSPIASAVPYMVASGNHERDWPNSGSFWDTTDSGGECGVPAETLYYVPADNRAKFWYSADYGMFKFCVADSEHDWRAGSEQYAWIEKCLASADRRKQPWLIFIAHRVLGYSSNYWYGQEGSFSEPEGREDLQKLWQKYKVDIAFFGHVHNYERICPIYQNQCVNDEKSHFSGVVNGTIHVVTGGGGKSLAKFSSLSPVWSVYRDYDWGFVKLTAFNHSSLLFEYKKSRDGEVYDSFTVYREYKDVLACVHDSCEPTTLAN